MKRRTQTTPQHTNHFLTGDFIGSAIASRVCGLVERAMIGGTRAAPAPAWEIRMANGETTMIFDNDAVLIAPIEAAGPARCGVNRPTMCARPATALVTTLVGGTGAEWQVPICQRCIDELTAAGNDLELTTLAVG